MPQAAIWKMQALRAALAAFLIALCGQAAFAQLPEPRRGPSAAAAVREILRHQTGAWTGHLLIQHRERVSEAIPTSRCAASCAVTAADGHSPAVGRLGAMSVTPTTIAHAAAER